MNKLFESVRIGSINVKNRIAMAPMNDFHQFYDSEGILTQRCIDHFVERAKGEVGLIISMVFKTGEQVDKYRYQGQPIWNILTAKSQERYADLARFVHGYGAKIFFQLSASPGRVAKGEVFFIN